jgi:putative ABC transport system ATP-binding protein
MTGTPMAVRCRELQRSFGPAGARVQALRGVNLDVEQGEVLMLVGPSGCGKTSLISIVSAVLAADGGSCEVLGQSVLQMTDSQKTLFRRRTMGFVFQAFNLLPQLSVAQNVAVPLLLDGMPPALAHQRAAAMLLQLGLGDRLNAAAAQLSGGQQQRVAIARALVHRPKVVVCDEPTSALDLHTGQNVMQLVAQTVREQGATLIVVTHDTRIFRFADRIAEMEDGDIVRHGRSTQPLHNPLTTASP